MCLDFIELFVDISDEGFGEGIGFGIEKEVEDISFLLEDGGLLEFFGSDFKKILELVNHRYDVIIIKQLSKYQQSHQGFYKIILKNQLPFNIDGQKCSFVGYIEATTQMHIISSEQSMDSTVCNSKGWVDDEEVEQAAEYITERNKITVEIRRQNRSQIFKTRRVGLKKQQKNGFSVLEKVQKRIIDPDPEIYLRVSKLLGILEREEEQTNQCQIMKKISQTIQQCNQEIFKLFFSEQKISLLISFCNSANEKVVEQAALILSKISGQLQEQRDFQLFISIPNLLLKWLSNLEMDNQKLYKYILLLFGNLCMYQKFIDIFQKIELQKHLFCYSLEHKQWKGQIKNLECWSISNFFRVKQRSSLSQAQKDLTALLFYCLINCDKKSISEPLLDCLKATESLIFIKDSEIINKILNVGLIPFVIKLINREKILQKNIIYLIFLIGNISCVGSINQLITILNYNGLVDLFCQLLKSTVKLKKNVLWAISNIVASDQGDGTVIRIVLNNQILVQLQKTMILKEPNVQKYTCSVFGNLLRSSHDKMQFIHNLEAIHFFETLCDLIQTQDIKIQEHVIEVLNTSFLGLSQPEQIVSFRQHFDQYSGMLLIQRLHMSQSEQVSAAAEQLTDKFGSIICTDRGV